MLADWLAAPPVAEWWGDPAEQLALIAEDLDNPAMTALIALAGGDPIAYAQHYPAHHWNAPHFHDLPPDAVAIDAFSAPQGMGQGGAWLDALARRLLESAPVLVIDPEPDNLRAIRAYEKAGFSGAEIRPSEDGSPARILTRRRSPAGHGADAHRQTS